MWLFTKRPEKRNSGGAYTDAVMRLIEAQAGGKAADASSTAAIEAASGALSRAFASARVDGPGWVRDSVSPGFLAQVGRDLIRSGDSLHVIRVGAEGNVGLIPAASWNFEGTHDPATWTVRVTCYGPSTSSTWNLPASAVVFVRWGSAPGQPYVGAGPTSWAHTTARLQSEAERSLADEASGPLAQIIPVPASPQEGEGDEDGDPLDPLRVAIAAARGKALLTETLAGGYEKGRAEAPHKDWVANRLGPSPPEGMVRIRKDAFEAMLAACGTPPSLFLDSDGTSQREAVRRWHLGTVLPLARILEHELSEKLETELRLVFDSYPLDLAGRAQAFQKLVSGGVSVNEALVTAGLLEGGDDG